MMNKVKSLISKAKAIFKRAEKISKEVALQTQQPVRPSGRVRSRDLVQPAQKQQVAATVPAKKAKTVLVKVPSKFAVRIDFSKIRSVFSGLAEASIKAASKREIDGFYGTKNYRSVLLSIKRNRSEDNFLAIKRELKAQDVLMSRFPGKILKSSKLLQRKGNVEVELNILENELAAAAREKRIEAAFRGRISSLDSQVSVFREIKKLTK